MNDINNEFEWATDVDTNTYGSDEIFDLSVNDFDQAEINEAVEQAIDIAQATEAQARADQAIENGDYEAAAHYREIAEENADAAGDDSMLHGPDSNDLEAADEHQDHAMELEAQQAEHAQEGDYEAARDDAFDAAQEMQAADQLAGGSDHSGQAELEFDQMDWAVHHEEQADYYADQAMDYAEQGDVDNAEMNAEQADYHQDFADHHGDLGEHGGDMAVTDPASEIQTEDYTTHQPTDYMYD